MEDSEVVAKEIKDSIHTKERFLEMAPAIISKAASLCSESLQAGGRVLLCGNGGSASDAQHISAELSGRYLKDRPPLDSEALHVNTSYLTAVANDYGYDEVYARLVEAKGRKGDVLIGLSTSGNSPNIVKALEVAKKKNMITIGFRGQKPGKMDEFCDLILPVPSPSTPRIQEAHILAGHIMCGLIEESVG